MTALVVNMSIAAWLYASAILLPQSTVTVWHTLAVASVIAAVAFLSFAAPGRPGLRFANAAVAVWLLASGLLLPHQALSTIVAGSAAAVALALVSLFPPAHWLRHWRDEHGGHQIEWPGGAD